MAFPIADRVLENSTISGNVAIVLAGPQAGYQAFGSGISANGDIVPYVLTDGSGLLWETGYGVYSGACISRQTIQYSVSGNAKIVFPDSSNKNVAMAPLANDFKNIVGSIGSGIFTIQSGSIGATNMASGAIQSGHIASGQIGQFHHSSGSVTSGHIGNNAVRSGSISSGQISLYHHASGNISQSVGPFVSGSPMTIITGETISGVRAVQISQSGFLRQAMATVSGRMPAVGVVVDNVASGIQANVYTTCVFQSPATTCDYSGYIGRPLYVSRSGQIVTTSGSFNSGGLLSGDVWHPVGYALNSGGGVVSMAAQHLFTMVSG